MIPTLQLGGMGLSGSARAVSFVAASGTTYVSAASQNQTIPAAAQVGDLALSVVMHRQALTPPAGWTLVASISCTEGTTTQYTSVYKRVVQSGDAGASTTWTQAAATRMAVHLMVFRKAGGCDVVDFDTASQNSDTTSSNVLAWAVSTATGDGQMGVAAASTIVSLASGATMTASSGTLTTPASADANRLGAAYLARNIGQTTTGTFTANFGGTTINGVAAVSVIVG